ncbi:hypothetical protein P4S72_16010 [Vibrio sp. PP-XX7]
MSISLPNKVFKLSVLAQNDELGILTHCSTHIYTPKRGRHTLPTMTKKEMGKVIHLEQFNPIFAQKTPEGFNRRFIAEKVARCASG